MEGCERMKGKLNKKIGKLAVEVNMENKLYLNRWKPDEQSHLSIIDSSVCAGQCPKKDCTVFCPAHVYEWQDGRITVGFEGCLECGACRIGCPKGNIRWCYPRGGFGVQFRLA